MVNRRAIALIHMEEASVFKNIPQLEACIVSCTITQMDSRYVDNMKIMIEHHPELLNTPQSDGWYPIHRAAFRVTGDGEEMAIFHQLVQSGVEVNMMSTGFDSTYPIILARHPIVIQTLIDYGANVNTSNSYGHTALHNQALRSNAECIGILLRNGAAPRIKDHHGNTAIDVYHIKKAMCTNLPDLPTNTIASLSTIPGKVTKKARS